MVLPLLFSQDSHSSDRDIETKKSPSTSSHNSSPLSIYPAFFVLPPDQLPTWSEESRKGRKTILPTRCLLLHGRPPFSPLRLWKKRQRPSPRKLFPEQPLKEASFHEPSFFIFFPTVPKTPSLETVLGDGRCRTRKSLTNQSPPPLF